MLHQRFLTIFYRLCLTLVVGLPLFPLSQAAEPQPGVANTPGILRFQAEGHILGFLPDQAYLAGLDHALRVEFVGTPGVMPQTAGAEAATFSPVTYSNLWPGIDLAYTATAGSVAKSTYTLAPGADPALIQLRYNTPVTQQADGSLRFTFASGYLEEAAPVAWQELGGQRVEVEVSFRLAARPLAAGAVPLVGFRVGRYDPHYPLVIDPTYAWHTFYGSSSSDWGGRAITVDGSGGVYMVGYSNTSWTGPAGQPPLHAHSGGYDFGVVKLDSNGAYQWHTFYGGSSDDYGDAIAVDSSGDVYVAGYSYTSWTGPAGQAPLYPYSGRGYADLGVVKLNSSGTYQWHTFFGSGNDDDGYAIAVDGSGGVYVAGHSAVSWIGPASQTPLHPHSGNRDFVVVKLDSSGIYQWHTFYGSSSHEYGLNLAVDSSGDVYVAGYSNASWTGPAGQTPLHPHSGSYDFGVVKLDSNGIYQWHTFYGSSNEDYGYAIAVDDSRGIYVTGYSAASWTGPAGQAPLHPHSGSYDFGVVKLDSNGTYQWHTFYGSSTQDYGYAIAVDDSGGVYVTGYSATSWTGPASQAPLHAYSGFLNFGVVKLDSSSGAYQWHTFFGSDSSEDYSYAVAVDGSGSVYVAGHSAASWTGPAGQVPLHAYSGDRDFAVVKLILASDIAVQGNSVVIADGNTTPSSANHTDFGPVTVGQALTRTFTISNSGELDLSISSLGLSGAATNDFSITGIISPTIVISAATTTFQVRFTPSVAGTRVATVTIVNNDPDETLYDFAIQGMGLNIAPIANAGNDQNVTAGNLVTLNGSASSDPNGHLPITYGWNQTGGLAVTLSSANIANPTFTAPTSTAVLTFSLTVTDSFGLADPTPDEVAVTINPVNVYLPLISKN